jgi:hypothetical protein
MREMTREEAIKEFEFCKDMILFNPNTGETYTVDYIESVNDDNARLYKACDKAIADMEKLQKIEALYGIDKFGAVLTREERDREVQKILEGNRK